MSPSFIGTISITSGHIPPPVLKIEPGDIIIISSPHALRDADVRAIQQQTKKLFPGHEPVVLSNSLTLSTAREKWVEIGPRDTPGSRPHS